MFVTLKRTSLFFQLVMIFKLKAHSGLFSLLHQPLEKSHFDTFQENQFVLLYLVWPIAAIAVNFATKVYAEKLVRNLSESSKIFTISWPVKEAARIGSRIKRKADRFSFSLNAVIFLPLVILFAVVSSVASRSVKLLIFYPLQMSLMAVALPYFIILKNPKMKKVLLNRLAPILPSKMSNRVAATPVRSAT